MKKFTNGVLVGSLIGISILSYSMGASTMSDNRARKRLLRSGMRAFDAAGDKMDDIKSRIW